MKKIRKYLVPLLLSLAMISQIFVAYGLEKDNITNITIFHTNDIHGRHAQGSENIQIGNLATLKKNTPNSILVDAGDNLHGLPFVNLSQGMDAVELMKSAGYDYMAPGNHDFNYGQDRLVELATAARSNDGFEIMAANVLKNNNTILKANDIKIIDGIKVGFLGLATTETTYKTNPNNVAGLEFKNPVDSAKEQVKDLKDKGAEVVIAIAHVGMDGSSNPTSIDVASKVEGIDVIVDGHSHTTLNNGKVVGNTLIVSTGEYLKNIGEVKISVDKTSKAIVSKSARLIEKEEVLKNVSDPAIEAKVNSIKEQQKPLLSKIIGKNTIELDGERQNVRTKESNLGNLINDAVLDETKADIAINNGGNIRKTIKVGDITKGDIIDVLPFGNTTVTKELTGDQIKKVLEHGVKDYPATSGGFPHVSGISYSFDPAQKAGERIVKILKDGKPLDMSKKYIVATNDFLAVGGDDFPCFGDVPTINEFGGLEESLIKYVQKLGTVSYALEGRITIESKELVVNEKAIKAVIDIINKIGENVTLKDKETVLEAKEAYIKLTDKEKALVTNYDKLTKSEDKIKEIESSKPDKNENNSQNNNQNSNQSNSQNNNKKPISPQTGDLSMVPFLFGVVASSAGLYVYNKRK